MRLKDRKEIKMILSTVKLEESNINLSLIRESKKVEFELEGTKETMIVDCVFLLAEFEDKKISITLKNNIKANTESLLSHFELFLNLANIGREYKTLEALYEYCEETQTEENKLEFTNEINEINEYNKKAIELLGKDFNYCEIGEEIDIRLNQIREGK